MARLGQTLWLIKRGPRPSYHKAPYHPVIVCDRKNVAKWEAGWTGDKCCVWEHGSKTAATGWLLVRWQGMDIDYGHVVRACEFPNGGKAAFVHDKSEEPWTLLNGAVWFSESQMPQWLESLGCVVAPDDFTQASIREGSRS